MPMPEWRFDNFALSPKVAKTKPQGQMVPRPLNPPPSSPDAASGVGKARIRPKFDFGPMSASKRSRPTKSMSPSGPGSKDGDEVTVLDATTIDDPRPIVPRDPGRISSTTSVSVPKSRPISKDCPMSFDFSGDSKLTNIKRKMLSIIDPEGKNTEAISSHVDLTVRRHVAIENAGGHKQQQKKFKPGGRFGGAPSIATWNDFKSAGGGTVAKEVRKVVNENSDDSQGGNNDYPPSRYLGNKKISSTTTTVSGTTCGFVPPTLGRKGMEGMGAKFDSKEEKVTGLRAEPSLKNFDENIINLIESEIMSVTRETGWSDVAGLEAAKKALREIVVLPFKRPDVFKGIRAPPKGVLLFGPPGTGKTMIGRCVASQCKATFFNISASSLTSKWNIFFLNYFFRPISPFPVGEGEKLVRALFAVARVKLPSVIFIDEIDSLLSSRSESEHESSRRIKTEFLVQLDGVATSSEERLLVLGATNRPQELDEAARRRFAKRLYIALPEGSARMEIVRSLLKDMDHKVGDAELGEVGRLTEGYSGADMRQMCAEASMGPIRDVDNSSTMDIETVNVDEIRPIMIQDFRDAARVVRPTVVAEDLRTYLEWDQKFGCLL